jgi:PAS domain-containing protein
LDLPATGQMPVPAEEYSLPYLTIMGMDKHHNSEGEAANTGNQLMQDDEARFFLASIIGTLQDSVVTINLDGRITSWNKAAERLYGYPASQAIGRSL